MSRYRYFACLVNSFRDSINFIFFKFFSVCPTHFIVLFENLNVLQYTIYITVHHLYYSTPFVLQYTICITVSYLYYSTLFVLQYTICITVHYLYSYVLVQCLLVIGWVLVEKLKGKNLRGRPRRRWKDKIKLNLR